MNLSRAVYSHDPKVAAMRALDGGATNGGIISKYRVSPRLLERWPRKWRAIRRAGIGHGAALPAMIEAAGFHQSFCCHVAPGRFELPIIWFVGKRHLLTR